MKAYLKAQLNRVKQLEQETDEVDEQYFDDMRAIVRETEIKAAEAGHAAIVTAC